jgi:hypothetical protein
MEDFLLKIAEWRLRLAEKLATLPRVSRKALLVGLAFLLAVPVLVVVIRLSLQDISPAPPPPAPPPVQQPLAITVRETTVLPMGQNTYAVVIRVLNPNRQKGARRIEFAISLNGNGGALLRTERHTSYLLADEEKQVVFPVLGITQKVSSATATVLGTEFTDTPLLGDLAFSFSRTNFSRQSGQWVIQSQLANGSLFTIRVADVTAFLYNSDTLVGATITQLRTLRPGERRFFILRTPVGFPANLTRVEIVPSVNILDPSVLETGRAPVQ